jgi:biotin operon repressor
MNTKTRQLIKDAAIFLLHFDRSNREFLKSTLQTTLLIIERIEKGETTIDDIALVLCISSDTVAETIRMLRSGGYPIAVREAGTQGCKYLVSIAPS